MLTFKNTKKLNLYNSLDTLKILTFWKIIQDKCILYLDFDYYDGKKYTNDQKHEIEQLWHRLYDEYYLLSNNAKSKAKIDKSFSELQNRTKITNLKSYIDFLYSLKEGINLVDKEIISKYEQQVYKNIKSIDKKIKPSYFKGIDFNIKYLNKYLNALINKYNIDNDIIKKEVNEQISNVYDVVASVESWLERSLPIEKITVKRWLSYEKQVYKKQKSVKQNGKR